MENLIMSFLQSSTGGQRCAMQIPFQTQMYHILVFPDFCCQCALSVCIVYIFTQGSLHGCEEYVGVRDP